MLKTNIGLNPMACMGCRACQLMCSLTYAGSFNPEKACIVVRPPKEISFSEECRLGCSLCARYCDGGALIRVKGE